MKKLGALMLAVAAAVALVPSTQVASGAPPLTGATSALTAAALVRVAHFSPDTAGVDVWVDGKKALENVGYDTVSDYVQLPAGEHEFALRPSGAAATTKAVVSAKATLVTGTAYTIAGVGPNSELRGQIFVDDLGAPPAGRAKVRIIDAVVGTNPIDVVLAGATTFDNVDFATASKYAPVGPKTYGVRVHNSAGSSVLEVPSVIVGAGIIYSFAVIGGAGKPLQLVPVVDARGAAVAPVGGAGTGGGGTARARVQTFPLITANS